MNIKLRDVPFQHAQEALREGLAAYGRWPEMFSEGQCRRLRDCMIAVVSGRRFAVYGTKRSLTVRFLP